MDAILRNVNDGNGDNTVLKEAPEEKLLEKWTEMINSSNFQLSDITNGLADLLAMKESNELTNVKNSVTKQFVAPKLEMVTNEENNVTHYRDLPTPFQQPIQEETESGPVSQPTKQVKCSKKKKANKITTAQNGPKNWTEDEEAALTRAWISIYTDDLNSTRPSPRGFWERVVEHFHEAMGKGIYRNNDALSGKWRDIKIKVTKFNDIYNNLSAQCKKGRNDFDVFNTALEQYRAEKGGKSFVYLKAWEIMSNSPDWVLGPETFSQTDRSKRCKTSKSNEYTETSDVRNSTDLKKDAHEIPAEEPIQCPIVQDKGKRVVLSLRENQTESNDLQYFKEKINEFLKILKQMMELKRDQQVLTDMQVLQLSTNNVEGEDLETMLAVKRAIREKYKKLL